MDSYVFGQVLRTAFGWLVADGWCWFVLREKYCWLVADKPSEHGYILLTLPQNE
jgi:hypothetical protein